MKRTMQDIMLMVCALTMGGCAATSGTGPLTMHEALPRQVGLPAVEKRLAVPQEGAIYREGVTNLYSDSRARDVGDILMVKIVETSKGQKKAETKADRSSSLTGGISSLFGFERWLADRNHRLTPSLTNMQTDFQNTFDGKGETKRDSTVTATLSARVVDRTLDDNLVIRGYKEVRVNNETQFIILSGIIRREDIADDNSVLSSNVADARIDYSGTGVIADKQQPGWLARGLDVVWPF